MKSMENIIYSTTESVLNDTINTIRITFSNLKNHSLLTNSNNNVNYAPTITNYSLKTEWSVDQQCKDGIFLPYWSNDGHTGVIVFHGMVYFFVLLYIFVGIALIADRFMLSIEQITSQEKDIIIRKPDGEKEIISVRIWNQTVSNLTLMALGSSAPEILLSIIEVYAQNFEAGDLGPGSIVGSAAFNMLFIVGICVWAVPSNTVKYIKNLRVFCVTMGFSLFAYIWLLFILIWSTPGVIEVWEGLLTFSFFPLTVLTAYMADKYLCICKYFDRKYRTKSSRKVIYDGLESNYRRENVELTNVDSNGFKVRVNDLKVKHNLKFFDVSKKVVRQIQKQRDEVIEILRDIKNKNPEVSNEELEKLARSELVRLQPKSIAYYRIRVARKILGLSDKKMKDSGSLESINNFQDINEGEHEEEIVKISFNPTEYTVSESMRCFTTIVNRSGCLESTITVEYNTDDGTARADSDYKPVKGIISFGPQESHKQIPIQVIYDHVFEGDKYFYVRLSNTRYLSPLTRNHKRPDIKIIDPEARVLILDDDHSGIFSFAKSLHQIPESIREYRLTVKRSRGVRGQVLLPYKTIPGTAKGGQDFIMTESKIVFNNNEANKDILLTIINNDHYEKNATFYVELGEPIRDDYHSSSDSDKGAPSLGKPTKCMIRIHESRHFRETVNKLMKISRAVSVINTYSSKKRFFEPIEVPKPELSYDQEIDSDVKARVIAGKSIRTHVIHYLTLFWKLVFRLIPPTTVCNGWVTFIISILVIGILSALIGDLASHFGCTVNLKDSVTAISLVALGTSALEIFADKMAALNDKYADSSIGNVAGCNAVNVFLGIGCAWTMAAVYHFFKGTEGGFKVNPGSLSYSIIIYFITAFICGSVLLVRRSLAVGGELGGPMICKLLTTLLFIGLWIFYVVMSSLEAYGYVKGF